MPAIIKRVASGSLVILGVMGPALIAGTANNDAGGISTYSYVGSRFGYSILWVMLVNLLTLACTQEIGVQLGVFTGKGLAALIRERFGASWTIIALLALFLANLAVATSEFAGIAASLELFGVPKAISVPFFGLLIWAVLFKGSFKKIERFFLGISTFFLVYILSAFLARPQWGDVVRSAVHPFLPVDKEAFMALLGVMGTTITPWGQFFIQSYVVDKGIDRNQYKIERLEVCVSAFWTCFIAAMIMITTKCVLFDHGIVVDSAEKAAMGLAPVLGSFAEHAFGLGFFFASLLGAFILPLTTAYSVCEALGFEHGIDRTWKQAPIFYSLMAVIIGFAVAVVFNPFFSLFQVMIFAQVVNGMLLPVILVFLVILLNERKKMGVPTGGKIETIVYNVITWEAILRLSTVSGMLVIFSLFPSALDVFKRWWESV